jgi:hypothetical protein
LDVIDTLAPSIEWVVVITSVLSTTTGDALSSVDTEEEEPVKLI